MRLKLNGCEHRAVSQWATDRFTCLSCYRRLRGQLDPKRVGADLLPDTPAGVCEHVSKVPISEAITKAQPYQDALCTQCGRVLRHPDRPGRWTEVMFYGYVIHEEP